MAGRAVLRFRGAAELVCEKLPQTFVLEPAQKSEVVVGREGLLLRCARVCSCVCVCVCKSVCVCVAHVQCSTCPLGTSLGVAMMMWCAVPPGGFLLDSSRQSLMISRRHAQLVLVDEGRWKV